ncbi:MAG: CoA pyrophosphatase [Desulfobacteraceae bacterium]|nr:CoA pyrophosphatase [Desulfobacteraceae bacterium]
MIHLPGGRAEDNERPEETALRELAEEVGLEPGSESVIGRLDDFTTRSGFVISPVVVWGGPDVTLTPDFAEVASVHRIPIAELMRDDAPILEEIPGTRHPVLMMPVGSSWIAAPTAALLYQFREVAILGKDTRVAHYEQPFFAWS